MTSVRRLYLDHNATAPLRPEARAAILSALDLTGNASSPHQEGRKARGLIDQAREQVAALCQSLPQSVIFTSGATEANAMALSPHLRLTDPTHKNARFDRLLVGATEHPSVMQGHGFAKEFVSTIKVNQDGLLDLGSLEEALQQCQSLGVHALVSIQAANSETGVLQDIGPISMLVHRYGGLLHVDAVQAAGRLPLDRLCVGADLLSLSAHKIGGPQGVGALVLRGGGLHFDLPLIRGGGQELGRRSGTENVAGLHAFGAACQAALNQLDQETPRLACLRDTLVAGLRSIDPALVVFGEKAERLPNTVYFAPSFFDAQTALMRFDLAGVALSSGSACSSGKVKESHVLIAMNIDPALRKRALRISLGWSSTQDDVNRFCELYAKEYRTKTGARAA